MTKRNDSETANTSQSRIPRREHVLGLTTLEPMLLMSASAAEVEWLEVEGVGWIGFGTDADERLEAVGEGEDTIFGEGGDDEIRGHHGDDRLFGGDGEDVIEGGSGDDHLDGEGGNDVIFGNDGDDNVILGRGSDVVDGGAGIDRLEIVDVEEGVIVDLTTGSVSGGVEATADSFEAVLGSSHDDVFRFENVDDGAVYYVHGDAGADTLDLSQYAPGTVVRDGGRIDVSVPGGSFTIYFDDVERIVGATGLEEVGELSFWDLPEEFRDRFSEYLESAGPPPLDVEPIHIGDDVMLDNYAPEPGDDFAETPEDVPVVIDVIENDTDLDHDPLTVTAIPDPPLHGVVSINPDGKVVYTPDPDYHGTDEFTYEVSDGNDGISTGLVRINVTPVNDAPVARDDRVFVGEDSGPDSGTNLLQNDEDVDGDELQIIKVDGEAGEIESGDNGAVFSPSGGGRVTVAPDGTMTFDPSGDFEDLGEGETRDLTFQYEITDGNDAGDTATVTVTIVGANDGPVALDDHFTVTAHNGFQSIGQVLLNDADIDGDEIRVITVNGDPGKVDVWTGWREFELPEGGFVNVRDGEVMFDARGAHADLAVGETRDLTFQYEIEDEHGATDMATVTITVVGVNDSPVAVADNFDVNAVDGYQSIGNVLNNDVDPDGDFLRVSAVDGDSEKVDVHTGWREHNLPGGGAVNVRDGELFFNARTDFNDLAAGETRDVSFEYEIVDEHGAVDTERVVVTVHGVNDGPVANGDSFNVNADDTLVGAGNLLSNDTDVDGDHLEIDSVDGDQNLVDRHDGARVYSPAGGGQVNVYKDGGFWFDPAGDFDHLGPGETANVEFEYEAVDGNGGRSVAVTTITVHGVNNGPVANGDSFSVNADDTLVGAGNLLSNDTDVDGDHLEIDSVDGDQNLVDRHDGARVYFPAGGGQVNVYKDGGFWFDPAGDFDHLGPGETANVEFEYEVVDGNGGRSVAVTTITVHGVNEGPQAINDSYVVNSNQNLSGARSLLANDTDRDGNSLRVVSVDGNPARVDTHTGAAIYDLPGGGQLNVYQDGEFWFMPNDDFSHLLHGETQDVTFQYEISDGQGGTSVATATITVVGSNQLPIALDDIFETSADRTFISSRSLLDNDRDPDGGRLRIASIDGDANLVDNNTGARVYSLESGGLVNVYEDGTFWFDPDGDFDDLFEGQSRSVEFRYEVVDENGGRTEATATISVQGTGRPPVAVDDHMFTHADSGMVPIGKLLENDQKDDRNEISVVRVDGDPGKVDTFNGMKIFDLSGGGRVNVYSDGTVLFDAANDFDHLFVGESQDVSFTYDIVDGRGAASTATAVITVRGTQPIPVAPTPAAAVPVMPVNTGYAAAAGSATGTQTSTQTMSVANQFMQAATGISIANGPGASASSSSVAGDGGQGRLDPFSGGNSNAFSETDGDQLTAMSSGENSSATARNSRMKIRR